MKPAFPPSEDWAGGMLSTQVYRLCACITTWIDSVTVGSVVVVLSPHFTGVYDQRSAVHLLCKENSHHLVFLLCKVMQLYEVWGAT